MSLSLQLAATVPPSRGDVNHADRVPVFSIRGLRKDYPGPAGQVTAVCNINAEIGAGLTAIVGPSGGGKTTTLNCIGGLDAPTGGQVWFYGTRLDFDNAAAMQRFRGAGVAWVFQELNLITHQTVAENVALPLLCRGIGRRDALVVARGMLEVLGIAHLADRSREQLSRGQQQRAAIARAFTSDAAVVLADEPTGSLDPETAETVMQIFRGMSHSEGKPVVLATHNHELAWKYCDRVLLCTADGLRDLTGETAADRLLPVPTADAGASYPEEGGRSLAPSQTTPPEVEPSSSIFPVKDAP